MKLLALAALFAPVTAWAGTCDPVAHTTIAASAIGLPTGGAAVTGVEQAADHCLVSGMIAPVDPAAPPIRFQLALPTAWNHKVVMLGGGGFEGTIPNVVAPMGLFGKTPLARGYAVMASDGGHKDPGADPGSFLMNDEAYRNWMGDALKKTRDAALVLVKAAYGAAPEHAYFLGGSSGGREGLIVAGRWPGDWDGVVSLYPARNSLSLVLGGLAMERAFSAPGAWPNPAKRQVLFHAALQACDALDGAADGVIANVTQCRAVFRPETVRCPEGRDTGDTCLSDAQLAALARIDAPVQAGPLTYPGSNVFLSECGTPGAPLQQLVALLSLGNTASTSFAAIYVDNFVRFAITRDPRFNALTLDPEHLGRYAARVHELAAIEAVDGDLTRFASRGGKLLIAHGTADLLVTPRATEAYYAELNRTMGKDRVDGFLRFYEIPGFGHGVSDNFNAGWDALTALEDWRERGIDPAANQVITDLVGVPGRTRPLCRYPAWPKYNGSGDMNAATAFTCARP